MLPLSAILRYRNNKVLQKFKSYFNISQEDAEDVFVEMLKWLWLCGKAKADRERGDLRAPRKLYVQSGMVIIDECWHVFILHTREYNDFCVEFIGDFVHHSPAGEGFEFPSQDDVEKQLSYIYDIFDGESTLEKWYDIYAEKYSLENIKKLRLDPTRFM